MIQKVWLRNFRAHRELELTLGRLTVLVGPNASGKTSVLDGLRLLSRLATDKGDRVFAGPDHPTLLRTRGVQGPIVFGASGRWKGSDGRVELVVKPHAEPPALEPHRWSYAPNCKYGEAEERELPLGRGFPELGAGLASARLLRLDPRQLAEPSTLDEPAPKMRDDGSGLASLLSYLKLSRESEFEEIQAALRRVVPQVERIRFDKVAVDRQVLETIVINEERIFRPRSEHLIADRISIDMRGAEQVPASSVGEGTLLALGLLAVLLGPDRPRLLLLDDLELALHPTAQRTLVEVFRELLTRFEELQIVATSHSPFVLDTLEPEEVWLTAIAPDGRTACRRLTEHPEFPRWKAMLRPGELWSTLGEEWVLAQGNPTRA